MSIMDKIENLLGEELNVSQTENGAIGYATTGKALLDLNFAVASLRSEVEDKIVKKFNKAFFDDKLLALKWLFFAGDVRGGLGERRLFKTVMVHLATYETTLARKLLPLIPEYTRWENMLVLLDTPLKGDVVELLKNQLILDEQKMAKKESISLCAKWLPSVNTSSAESKRYAKILVKEWGITEKEYRKRISALRSYLGVIEVKMSRKAWWDIDYESVPSKANLLYGEAFLRNDEIRRKEYLSALEKGEVKINSSVLFPHDIVQKYSETQGFWDIVVKEYNVALEEMWKGLPDYVKGDGTTLCVADGSGSMDVSIGGSSVKARHVAVALSIYFAERCKGEFKDKFITFSANPCFIDMSKAKSLHDKIGISYAYDEVANTNIEAVFDLVLATALKHKMTQEELPKNILILSDMEFDECAESTNYGDPVDNGFEKLFAVIGKRYEQYGYKLPRLVFWNLNSRTGTIPIKENEMGVALVSGFSPSIATMVLSGKMDPFECLLDALNVERYKAIEEAVKDVLR